MESNLSVKEQICFSTTRIVVKNDDSSKSYGTGFFFSFRITYEDKKYFVPYIVTNKHVIESGNEISFCFSRAESENRPLFGEPLYQVIGDKSQIINHPDSSVDLCIIPIWIFIAIRNASGINIFYKSLSKDIMPSIEDLNKLEPIENVYIIGYPTGLWDETNNMPIVRNGITASAPYLDFNGKKVFLIDASCFPGSSGSPVFIYDNGSYHKKASNAIILGSRLYFLGILSKGATLSIKGNIQKINDPKAVASANAITQIPTNLGYVIKASVLDDFIPLIIDQCKNQNLFK